MTEPFPARTNHPPSCQQCNGAGWQTGNPLHHTVNGELHRYTTLEPCTHDHWNDDPWPDQPLGANDPQAMAAMARGYIEGQHELWIDSHGRLGSEHKP